MDDYYFAKIAYDGYREFSDGRSLISGQAIPDFDMLPEQIKDAWKAAADAVLMEK